MMSVMEKVESILSAPLGRLGIDIVRIEFRGDRKKVLQIMIERQDRHPVSMDDCVRVSRESSVLLDVDDPIDSAYDLEVTSPGLDRPLVKLADYVRFSGSEVKVKTKSPVGDGKMRGFRGVIQGLREREVGFRVEGAEESPLWVEFDNIRKANLIPDFSTTLPDGDDV